MDDEVIDTLHNLRIAEAMTGHKMPNPNDASEIAKKLDDPFAVPYYLADE